MKVVCTFCISFVYAIVVLALNVTGTDYKPFKFRPDDDAVVKHEMYPKRKGNTNFKPKEL